VDKPEQRVDPDHARIRVLYRIPAVPARGRVLELVVTGESILRGRNWASEHVVVDVSGPEGAGGLPFPDGSFDVVVVHRTLDRMSALARRNGRKFVVGDFLSQSARLLCDDGLVIGCVENRLGLDRVLRGVKRLFDRAVDDATVAGPLSVLACHRALAAAGFKEIRLFNMLPDSDAPRRVMSIETSWSRSECKRQVEGMRGLVGPSSYAMWRILAELGVSQYLGTATFFWGRKAC
jgi:SAM-dependent methyltransferase